MDKELRRQDDKQMGEIMYMLGEIHSEIKGVNSRLDKVNGQLDKHETKLDELESFKDTTVGKISIISVVFGFVGSFVVWIIQQFIKI